MAKGKANKNFVKSLRLNAMDVLPKFQTKEIELKIIPKTKMWIVENLWILNQNPNPTYQNFDDFFFSLRRKGESMDRFARTRNVSFRQNKWACGIIALINYGHQHKVRNELIKRVCHQELCVVNQKLTSSSTSNQRQMDERQLTFLARERTHTVDFIQERAHTDLPLQFSLLCILSNDDPGYVLICKYIFNSVCAKLTGTGIVANMRTQNGQL